MYFEIVIKIKRMRKAPNNPESTIDILNPYPTNDTPPKTTIATPNGYHASQAIQALENGCNVVIEKP